MIPVYETFREMIWFVTVYEWEEIDGEWEIKDGKCVRVDGEKIKPNVWYKLENGEFVEVEE